jgi:hypothetical protein
MQIANHDIQVWNEKDPARRRLLFTNGWAKDAVYVDPLAQGGLPEHESLSRRRPSIPSRRTFLAAHWVERLSSRAGIGISRHRNDG